MLFSFFLSSIFFYRFSLLCVGFNGQSGSQQGVSILRQKEAKVHIRAEDSPSSVFTVHKLPPSRSLPRSPLLGCLSLNLIPTQVLLLLIGGRGAASLWDLQKI